MMKLDDALAQVNSLGMDTSPFIYLIERNMTYINVVREVVARISSRRIAAYTSVVTLTEVLVQPIRLGDTNLVQRYRRFLTSSRGLSLVDIDRSIAERAAALRARYNIRTPDTLQIATALASGCEAFLTNDAALQRISELRVVTIDALEL